MALLGDLLLGGELHGFRMCDHPVEPLAQHLPGPRVWQQMQPGFQGFTDGRQSGSRVRLTRHQQAFPEVPGDGVIDDGRQLESQHDLQRAHIVGQPGHRSVLPGVKQGVEHLRRQQILLLDARNEERRACAVQQPQKIVCDKLQPAEAKLVGVDRSCADLGGDRPDPDSVVQIEVATADQGGGVVVGLRLVENVPSGVSGLVDVGEQRGAGFSHVFLLSVLLGAWEIGTRAPNFKARRSTNDASQPFR